MFGAHYTTMVEIMDKENTLISFVYCLFFTMSPAYRTYKPLCASS